MIAKNVQQYCAEEVSNIENYDKAVIDDEIWELHHRRETHDKDGNLLDSSLLRADLITQGLYYKRPASELIFLTESEHKKLHMLRNTRAKGKNLGNKNAKGNVLSEQTRKQMGMSRIGNSNNGIALIRCIETNVVMRTREWIKEGYTNAYAVAKGYQKTCKGFHFEYVL